ncbi:MAG: TIGR02147 family protein [Fibrobacteria bacterium]|nr:TIGR02147 family protein [Fibrobacteria bacterium]
MSAPPLLPERSGAPEIYEFVEYRRYLQAHVEWRRGLGKPVSVRQIALRLKIDHSLLAKILQGTRHLGPAHLGTVASWLRLDQARCTYLEAMIAYARSRNDEALHRHFERLRTLRPVDPRCGDAAPHAPSATLAVSPCPPFPTKTEFAAQTGPGPTVGTPPPFEHTRSEPAWSASNALA